MLVYGRIEEEKSSAPDGEFSTGGAQPSSTSVTTPGNPCGRLNKEHYCSSTWQAAANPPSVTLRGPNLRSLFQRENGLNARTEHRLLFQTKPVLCQFLVQRLQTKSWSLSPGAAQFDEPLCQCHFCMCTRKNRFGKRLHRNCHSNWDCSRMRSREMLQPGKCILPRRGQQQNRYRDSSMSLQGISFHLCLCVLCSKDVTLRSLIWGSQKFPLQWSSVNIFKLPAFLSIPASARSLFQDLVILCHHLCC